jgi:DNA-binding response OmpR family regulator
MAKIRSIFRRTNSSTECIPPHKLSIDNLLLNTGNFTLQFMDKHVELSKNEFKLIKKFMENADKVITREELLMELWDDSSFVEDNTLTVNITRVKNILLELGIGDAIKTKKGVGYLFDSSFKLVGDEKNE